MAWVCLGLFLASFIPRAAFPLATSVGYDELAAKDSGPMLDLLMAGNFRSEEWAHYPFFPYYKYVYGLVPQVLFNSDPTDPADLAGARGIGALLGSAIVVMTFLVGIRCLPFPAALLGALLLASFPTVLGHDRLALHDAPSRLLLLVGWWFVLRAFPGGGRRDNPEAASPGRAAASEDGPNLAVLVWGAVFFGLGCTFFHRTGSQSGLAVAIWLLVRLWRGEPREDGRRGLRLPQRRTLQTLALFGGVSLGVFALSAWLLWPYMWFRPWELLRWYADPVAEAGKGGGLELWLGTLRVVPWYYYLVALLVCTPPLTLLAFAGWHLGLLRAWVARGKPPEGTHRRAPPSEPLVILLLFWIPLLVCSLATRGHLAHYLQILMPALCLGAGWGIWQLCGWVLAKTAPSGRPLGWLVLATPILMQVYACSTVSPYFFEYFNIFTGGGANVTRKRLFIQGMYGEVMYPLFEHVKTKAEPGSTVLCRLGPWPGLGQLNRFLGPGLLLQGHQAIDPLGARYILRAGFERDSEFYRYRPDTRFYEKVFDVLADGGSLGEVWRRKEELPATGLLYSDDFASPQFARFAVAAQNVNLNPFSDGKLYSVQPGQPAAVVQRFPAALFAGKRSVRVEADVQMREGDIRILAGHDPRQLREVARASAVKGTVQGADLPLTSGKDLFVALEWRTAHRWNGRPRTFWDSDWLDAFRIYGK